MWCCEATKKYYLNWNIQIDKERTEFMIARPSNTRGSRANLLGTTALKFGEAEIQPASTVSSRVLKKQAASRQKRSGLLVTRWQSWRGRLFDSSPASLTIREKRSRRETAWCTRRSSWNDLESFAQLYSAPCHKHYS